MCFVKFIKLESYLSPILGIKVDLVTRKALKLCIGKQILKKIQYVYGKGKLKVEEQLRIQN